jgi:hypothetical protein
MISNAFRLASIKKPLYSHAGIVHQQGGHFYVIHLIDGGESNGKIQMQPIEQFCSKSECFSFGIYRTEIKDSEIDKNALLLLRSGIHFDSRFELSTNDKMYCTEMIYKTLQKSSPDFSLPLTTVSGQTYVACDDLFLAKGNQLIFNHTY